MENQTAFYDSPALKYLRIYSKHYPGIFEAYDEVTSKPCADLINETAGMLFEKKYVMNGNGYYFYKKAIYTAASLVCLGEWRKYKMVYSISEPLTNLLCEMDDFEMLPEAFAHLPYSSFFVENTTDIFSGAFVKYIKSDNTIFLLVSILSQKAERALMLPITIEASKKVYEQIKLVLTGFTPDNDFPIKATKDYLFYIFQVALYLSSKKPDIVEDDTQKKIYKKKNRIRDKITEVQKWNVGYRIVVERNPKTISSTSSNIEDDSNYQATKRQHWRKAHWHTYWVGKGRTQKEIKFIAPILVNDVKDVLPVVEHNV